MVAVQNITVFSRPREEAIETRSPRAFYESFMMVILRECPPLFCVCPMRGSMNYECLPHLTVFPPAPSATMFHLPCGGGEPLDHFLFVSRIY